MRRRHESIYRLMTVLGQHELEAQATATLAGPDRIQVTEVRDRRVAPEGSQR